MDYHRLRPQSVPHASPKRGVSQAADGIATIDLPGPVLDPEADADRVYQLLIEAMEAIRQAMVTIRNDLAKAVRAAGLWYHEPTPRPTAARAKRASLLNQLRRLAPWLIFAAPRAANPCTSRVPPMYLACTWGVSPSLLAAQSGRYNGV